MFAELFQDKLQGIVQLLPSQIERLEKHFQLLQRWNRVVNLTSLENPAEIAERHFAESLFLGVHLPAGAFRIADIGSGAGFPGIPVAILRLDCTVTLVESHKRKSVFLQECRRELELSNVRVSSQRIEDVQGPFDWAISRGVKFSDIENVTAGIANFVALLGGEDIPAGKCFTWNTPSQLPWGNRRFLWTGQRST